MNLVGIASAIVGGALEVVGAFASMLITLYTRMPTAPIMGLTTGAALLMGGNVIRRGRRRRD
jgi:hypothetical protein